MKTEQDSPRFEAIDRFLIENQKRGINAAIVRSAQFAAGMDVVRAHLSIVPSMTYRDIFLSAIQQDSVPCANLGGIFDCGLDFNCWKNNIQNLINQVGDLTGQVGTAIANASHFQDLYNWASTNYQIALKQIAELDPQNPASWLATFAQKYGDSALWAPFGWILKYAPRTLRCPGDIKSGEWWKCELGIFGEFIKNTFPMDEFMIVLNAYYGNYPGAVVAAIRLQVKQIIWVLDQDEIRKALKIGINDVTNIKLITGIMLSSTDLVQIIFQKGLGAFSDPATYVFLGGLITSLAKSKPLGGLGDLSFVGDPDEIIRQIGDAISFNGTIIAAMLGNGDISTEVKKKYLDPIAGMFTSGVKSEDSLRLDAHGMANSVALGATVFGALAALVYQVGELAEQIIPDVGTLQHDVALLFHTVAYDIEKAANQINQLSVTIENAVDAAKALGAGDYVAVIKDTAKAALSFSTQLGADATVTNAFKAVIASTDALKHIVMDGPKAFYNATFYISLGVALQDLGGDVGGVGNALVKHAELIASVMNTGSNSATTTELMQKQYIEVGAGLAIAGLVAVDVVLGEQQKTATLLHQASGMILGIGGFLGKTLELLNAFARYGNLDQKLAPLKDAVNFMKSLEPTLVGVAGLFDYIGQMIAATVSANGKPATYTPVLQTTTQPSGETTVTITVPTVDSVVADVQTLPPIAIAAIVAAAALLII